MVSYTRYYQIIVLLILLCACGSDQGDIVRNNSASYFTCASNEPFGVGAKPDILLFPAKMDVGGFSQIGYIDSTGQTRIGPRFDDGTFMVNGIAAVKIGHLWGVIDSEGDWIREPEFLSAFEPSCGRVLVQEEINKFVFLDTNGEYLIQDYFISARSFRSELAAVAVSNEKATVGENYGSQALAWGYLKSDGSWFLRPNRDVTFANDFYSGFANITHERYVYNSNILLLNECAEISWLVPAIELILDDPWILNEEAENGLFSYPGQYLPKSGELIQISPQTSVSDGVVISEGSCVYSVSNGKQLFFSEFPTGLSANQRILFRNHDGYCGYFDHDGSVAIPPKFLSGMRFGEGLAFVETVDGVHIIDTGGRFASDMLLQYLTRFVEGRAVVLEKGHDKFSLIGKNAELLNADFIDEPLGPFRGGLCPVVIDGAYSYIDKRGSIIWQGATFGSK